MRQKKEATSLMKAAKNMYSELDEKLGPKDMRSLKLAGVSGSANLFVGAGKLALGIFSLSFFTCVSAFYTFGMVVAKYFALAGILKAKNKQEQYRYYFLSGIILVVASLLFIAYSVRLFLRPEISVYDMYTALAIATFTFAELGINIRGVLVERHNHTPLFHAIKMINLASSLICLVLTQTAILSFSDTQTDLHPTANGMIGIVMGIGATVIGIVMIVRIRRIQTGRNFQQIFRKVKKLMKREGITGKLEPVIYNEDNKNESVLIVIVPEDISAEEFDRLCVYANTKLRLKIVALKHAQLYTGGTDNDQYISS